MWYTPNHTLTHNALINMVIGPRGCGKTYGLKTFVMKKFIACGDQFVYIRRHQDEVDKVKDTLFSDTPFPIDCKGMLFIHNEKCCGYIIPLSTSHKLKSASFPNVKWVVFDEFIIDEKKNQRYLKYEVDTFLNLLETIIRTRDNVRVFMLANSLSFFNPYTMYWGFKYSGNSITKAQNGLVLCEIFNDPEFKEMKEKTRFGQLIKDTKFAEMSVDNKFYLDNYEFIAKKQGNWKYCCGLVIEGNELGVWNQGYLFFFDRKIQKNLPAYCVSPEDHGPGRIFDRHPPFFTTVMKSYKMGNCMFSGVDVKNLVVRFLAGYC